MIKYRTEIDGLRTVAVIPVILFHLGYGFAKGGFYGVDVFFVISGYLITKILTDNIENGTFSMYQFWIRRVKRLLPLLLTVILTTLFVAPLLFKPIVKDISNDVFPSLFSYFNFHALFNFGDYWGGEAEQSLFLHTWSLSVEEQFYLIYPFFLLFAHRYFKNFVIPILTITIVSLVLFTFFLLNKDVNIAFYLLPTRIWELSLGGLVGVINKNKFAQYNSKNTLQTYLPIIGISLIGYAYLFSGKTIGFFAVFPVIGSALIILFCSPKDIVGKLLSSKVLVFIGKISYSLYLWHWIIILLCKNLPQYFYFMNRHILNGLIVFLTFLLAYLSYTFIENKTRNYKHTPKIVLAGIALIVGITFYLQSEFYNPYYKTKYNKQIVYFSYYNIAPNAKKPDTLNTFYYNVSSPLRLQKFNDAYKKEGIITNNKNGIPKIILLGDSHGVMWSKLLNEISDELNVTISFYTANAFTPFFNLNDINSQVASKSFNKVQRTEYAKSFVENVEKWKPQLVIIATRWENNINDERFYDLLGFLEKRNIQVLLLNQPPVLTFMGDKTNPSQFFTYLGIQPVEGYNLMEVKYPIVAKRNNELRTIASKYTQVSIYDAYNNMIENNKVKISLNKDVLYYDDDHLNYYGTLIHKANISSMIKNIINLNNNLQTQEDETGSLPRHLQEMDSSEGK